MKVLKMSIIASILGFSGFVFGATAIEYNTGLSEQTEITIKTTTPNFGKRNDLPSYPVSRDPPRVQIQESIIPATKGTFTNKPDFPKK